MASIFHSFPFPPSGPASRSTRPWPPGLTWKTFAAAALTPLLWLGLTLALAIPPAARAQPPIESGIDPSELFLKAFTSVQQAETAENDGKLKVALSKYRFAASLLDQISQNHPNWQPLILQYRSRKTADAITKLQQRIAVQPAAPATPIGFDPLPAVTSFPANPAPPTARGSTGAGGGDGGTRRGLPLTIDEDPLPEPDRVPGGFPRNYPSAGGANNVTTTNNPPPTAGGGGGGNGDDAGLPSATTPTRGNASVSKATQEARAKIDKLNEELKDTRKQLDAAQREKKQLQGQLDSSQDELKTAQKKFETTRKNRDEIEADLVKVQDRLKEVASKNTEATNESRKELRKQLADLKTKLESAETASKLAAKEKDSLTNKLAAAQVKNALGVARDLPRETDEKVEALKAENAGLTQRLQAAERTIADLNVEAAKKKDEAEAVQVQLAKLKEQLTTSQDRNDRSETEVTQLRKQLDDQQERMKAGLPKEEAVKLAKENDLLRNISLRLLKDQAIRVQSRKLLGDELARLEVQSKTLTEQLDLLGQPNVQLSDEERALFKDPLVNISDSGDPSTMAASIIAVSPTNRSPVGGGAMDDPAAAVAAATGGGALPGGAPSSSSPPDAANPAASLPPPVPAELVPLAKEAKENLDRGRYPEAEEAYNKLIARAPKSVYGLANLGVVLSRQGKLKSAETKLKKAVTLAPNDPFSQATLGIVYYQMRRFDDALDCLTKAIQLDPKNASAHNYLGITSSQKGWPEAAVEELEKALALKPDYADAHFNLAVVYAINQPPAKEKAKQHYVMATQLGAAPDPQLEKLIN